MTPPPQVTLRMEVFIMNIYSQIIETQPVWGLGAYCIHNVGSTNCTYDFCPQWWQKASYAHHTMGYLRVMWNSRQRHDRWRACGLEWYATVCMVMKKRMVWLIMWRVWQFSTNLYLPSHKKNYTLKASLKYK